MIPLPTGPLLFDTGIYIRFSRGEDDLWMGEDAQVFQRTILTAVVAAELYAGTHDHREKRALGELCHAYNALGHFSSPTAAAWIDTGILLRSCSKHFWRNGFRPPFSRSADCSGGGPGRGHARDRKCRRLRALEITPCLRTKDSEALQFIVGQELGPCSLSY